MALVLIKNDQFPSILLSETENVLLNTVSSLVNLLLIYQALLSVRTDTNKSYQENLKMTLETQARRRFTLPNCKKLDCSEETLLYRAVERLDMDRGVSAGLD